MKTNKMLLLIFACVFFLMGCNTGEFTMTTDSIRATLMNFSCEEYEEEPTTMVPLRASLFRDGWISPISQPNPCVITEDVAYLMVTLEVKLEEKQTIQAVQITAYTVRGDGTTTQAIFMIAAFGDDAISWVLMDGSTRVLWPSDSNTIAKFLVKIEDVSIHHQIIVDKILYKVDGEVGEKEVMLYEHLNANKMDVYVLPLIEVEQRNQTDDGYMVLVDIKGYARNTELIHELITVVFKNKQTHKELKRETQTLGVEFNILSSDSALQEGDFYIEVLYQIRFTAERIDLSRFLVFKDESAFTFGE